MSDYSDISRTNLIINYLPQTLTDTEFNQLFATLGPLQSARILRDKRTGYSFGYGFVNYQKDKDAKRGKRTVGVNRRLIAASLIDIQTTVQTYHKLSSIIVSILNSHRDTRWVTTHA